MNLQKMKMIMKDMIRRTYVMNAAKISKENITAKDATAPIQMKLTMKNMIQRTYVLNAEKISEGRINAKDVSFLIQSKMSQKTTTTMKLNAHSTKRPETIWERGSIT